MKNSIIIPVYNEASVIVNCLKSLANQLNAKDNEIILVDDGSTDNTIKMAADSGVDHKLLNQNHQGPGAARNLAAKEAIGEILIFVDADMEFEPDFVPTLIAPIQAGKTVGTYSTEEYLLNKDDPWAVCWNLNFTGRPDKVSNESQTAGTLNLYGKFKSFLEELEEKIAPISHKNITVIGGGQNNLPFRAIIKSAFLSVGGFSIGVGYTDDWTLAQKLNQLPAPVSAKYYHKSPSSLAEIYHQARWIGRGELNTGNIVRKIHALLVHNPVSSVIAGIVKALRFTNARLLIFRLVYGLGITLSVLESFLTKNTAR